MITAKVRGVEDVTRALDGLKVALKKKILLGALKEAGKVIQAEARRQTPVLRQVVKNRRPGTVKRAISVRVSKVSRREGNVGAFINVRPAESGYRSKRIQGKYTRVRNKKKITAGANSRNDPYYWRWLEFGTKKMAARPFLRPAANKLDEALSVFEKQVGPQIQRFNK